MNLLLTTLCNRRCKYCFALDKIDHKEISNDNYFISIENVKKVIKFMKFSKVKNFSLLGGEPTIHPHFPLIVEMLQEEDFNINVFTNGIIPKASLEAIKKINPDKLHLTVNANEPDENKEGEWKVITEVFETLPEHVGLGFNLYRKDFNPDFLVELINKYNLRKYIRFGLAQPVIGEKNMFIKPEEYFDIAQRIVDFSDLCDKYDITFGFDCGFTFCMFNDEQMGRLVKNNMMIKSSCGPAIDIGPDLSVWSCFPMSKIENKPLTFFNDAEHINRYYREKFKKIYEKGVYESCEGCKYLRRHQCNGGCATHIFNNNKELRDEIIGSDIINPC